MSEKSSYSNLKALMALTKASLQSTMKSPSAIVFTVAFPLIFILVFGFLGSGNLFKLNVVKAPDIDTNNNLYTALVATDAIRWVEPEEDNVNDILSNGDIAAVLNIQPVTTDSTTKYKILLTAAEAQKDQAAQLKAIVKNALQSTDSVIQARTNAIAHVDVQMAEVREFKKIDFVLPGQLGFSLLAGSVFGTAFIFLNLRDTLVLKRFFATPVRKYIIVLSEGLARMIYQLLGAVIIIMVGYFAFDYTLIHGILTFIELIMLCSLGILVFMGFGFIISGIAKSTNTVPPLSNIVTLPQFLLAGTFFPIEEFPKWLQPFCKILPLTYLNDALRRVGFDGAGLWDIKIDILILIIWGVVLYAVASKVFRWE